MEGVNTLSRLEIGRALHAEGMRLAASDKIIDAIQCFLKAMQYVDALQGKEERLLRADIMWNLGAIEIWRGRYGTAHDNLLEAVQLCPRNVLYMAYMAQSCMELGCHHKAQHYLSKAQSEIIDDPGLFSMLACTWQKMGNLAESERLWRCAEDKASRNADALYLLGNSAYVAGDKERAKGFYRNAVSINAEHPDAHHGLAVILSEERKFREVIPHAELGMKSSISAHISEWLKALAHLSLGELKEGFDHYESRWALAEQEYGSALMSMRHDKPEWNPGMPPAILHIYSDQGFGDCIQFSRFILPLLAKGNKVIFEVDQSMVGLMQYNFPEASIVPLSVDYPGISGIPSCDYRIALGSLPGKFGITLETIPYSRRYLVADHEHIEKWRSWCVSTRKKIGVCWAGGKRVNDKNLIAMDKDRSISLGQIKEIFTLENHEFFSLQTGLPAEEGMKTPDIKSWLDTAGIIHHMDAVVSVDTSVLHLAAAMGIPTYLLNKYASCWRWMEERTDSPWYNSLTIIRPRFYNDWPYVVEQAKEALWRI